MRNFALILIATVLLIVFTGGAFSAANTQITRGDIVSASDQQTSASTQVLGVVLVLGVGGLVGFLVLRSSAAKTRSATQAVQQASRLPEQAREDAILRVAKNVGRDESYQQVFVYDELARNFHTYRAAYELVVRGLQIKLYAEPPNPDFNFSSRKMRKMNLEKAECFTTESLASNLKEMASISEFSKHVPYHRRNRFALVVHTDDLEEAFELFLDLGIRRVGTPGSQRL